MKKYLVLFVIICLFTQVFSQQSKKEFNYSDYTAMRKDLGVMFQQRNFTEAVQLLEWALKKFPDNVFANSFNLAVAYGNLKEYDKGIEALSFAHDKGYWFNIWTFNGDFWTPFKEFKEFEKITEKNEALRQEAQKNAKPELIIVTPENYSKEKSYPLFIALHGGGENIAYFKNVWVSKKLREEFIVAYPQSSQVVAMNGFSWTEDLSVAEKEIKDVYMRMKKDYRIKDSDVIIGGFSSGGMGAVEIVMNNTFPVSGFISLCPAKNESFTDENIRNAKERGIRGVILTTEMDPRVEVQKEMVELLKKEHFPHQFVITPDIGHWIPEDLNVKIDNAIDFIRSKK